MAPFLIIIYTIPRASKKAPIKQTASIEQTAPVEQKATELDNNSVSFTVVKGVHTQTGEDLYTVKASGTVSRQEFNSILSKAKENNGFYSRFSKGFNFKTEADAKAFVNSVSGNEVNADDDTFFRKGDTNSDAFTEEEQEIISKAENNAFKAPNGKPSNLTPKQWAEARTQAFKERFGDWEKAARIEKLRNSEPIVVSSEDYQGKYELNRASAKNWLKDNVRGAYINKDTNQKVEVSRVSIDKVTSHGEREEAHLKSLSVIPQLIENSIFIEERANTKDNGKYDTYQYYVVGINIDGVDYTAKIVFGVKGDVKYYDHNLTEIEKGALIDNLNVITKHVADNQNSLYKDKDSVLISILQTNSSKVVDENGEPLAVCFENSSNTSEIGDELALEEADMNAKQKLPDSLLEEDGVLFRITKSVRATIDSWLNKRKDLTSDEKQEFIDYIDAIDDSKVQLATAKWFVAGNVRVPEDQPKIDQAIKVAKIAKVDPMQYKSPMELIDAHANIKAKDSRIDPDTVPTLTNKKVYDDGIVVYDVENTKAGQADMRKIINTHFGEDSSPWCLLQGDGKGNLTEDSWDYWENYDSIQKRVAFKDGKLLAFSANDYNEVIWWDRQDSSHRGIPITKKMPNDALGRTATYLYQTDFIIGKDNSKVSFKGYENLDKEQKEVIDYLIPLMEENYKNSNSPSDIFSSALGEWENAAEDNNVTSNQLDFRLMDMLSRLAFKGVELSDNELRYIL